MHAAALQRPANCTYRDRYHKSLATLSTIYVQFEKHNAASIAANLGVQLLPKCAAAAPLEARGGLQSLIHFALGPAQQFDNK